MPAQSKIRPMQINLPFPANMAIVRCAISGVLAVDRPPLARAHVRAARHALVPRTALGNASAAAQQHAVLVAASQGARS